MYDYLSGRLVARGPDEVVVDVGGQEIVSAITRHAAENLAIQAGDEVTAVIKATEVLLDK